MSDKAEKAKAAANMGRRLLSFGVSHNDAAEAAHHELQHALADQGTGVIGVDVDVKSGKVKPYYQAKGSRSAEEELKYTQAPSVLSASDQRRIKELRAELKAKTKFKWPWQK